MIRHLLSFGLLALAGIGPAGAQCSGIFPPNTYCGNLTASPALPAPITIPGGGATNPYVVTGGTTSRSDVDRWVDNSISATDIGVDCTNVADSTTAIQNYVNAHKDRVHIKFPLGCNFFTTQPIVLSDHSAPVFESDTFQGNGGVPTWFWKGTNGGDACIASKYNCKYVLMFFQTEHPTVRNISFNAPDGGATAFISGAAAGAGGVVRYTVNDSSVLTNGAQVVIAHVQGTYEGNGKRRINIIDGTHVDVLGTVFSHAWTSGGNIYDFRKDFCPDGFLLFDGQPGRATIAGGNPGSSSGTTVTVPGPYFFTPQDVGLAIQAGTFNGTIQAFISQTQVTVSGTAGTQSNINVNVGQHIGTNGRVVGNAFNSGSCGNPMFVGVDISPTAFNNQENYVVYDNGAFCGYTLAGKWSDVGVTNGTTTLTAANNPFTQTDVGSRIRVTFAFGWFDTTIADFVSAGQVTLAAAVPFTQSNVRVLVGDSYGVAVRNGASQNAIQQQINKLQYTNCAYGIYGAGGNMQIMQPSGGGSDFGIFIAGFTAQNTSIDFYASESDVIAIWLGAANVAPVQITNSRFSNSNQNAAGHVNIGTNAYMANSLFNFYLPNTNSVLVGKQKTYGTVKNQVIIGGSGYVNGTYTNVPLTLVSGGHPYGTALTATVTVTGGAVTAVGSLPAGNAGHIPGDFYTASNANLGGSGSGFLLQLTGTGTNFVTNDVKFTSQNNHYLGSGGGSVPTWLTSGLGLFAFDTTSMVTFPSATDTSVRSEPVTSINDDIPGTNSGGFGVHQFGCWTGPNLPNNLGCVSVLAAMPGPAGGIGLNVLADTQISTSGPVVNIKSSAITQGGTTFTGVLSQPTTGNISTSQTMFEAGWNATALLNNPTLYGFRSRTPTSIVSNTNMYGFYCDKQFVTNVTNSYCFYASDPADANSFAGGVTTPATTVAALPTCNAANKGRRMFVSDGNTANAFRGAVTGGGTNNQWITCDGTSWLQG